MRIQRVILLPVLCASFLACSEDEKKDAAEEVEVAATIFDVAPSFVDVGTFGLVQTSSTTLTQSSTNLYSVDDNGNLAEATDIEVSTFSHNHGVTIVKNADGAAFFRLPSGEVVQPVGQTTFERVAANGDVVYTSSEKFYLVDGDTGETGEINSSLDSPSIIKVTGNFALITGGDASPSYQVLDVVSKNRYNIAACNGPNIIALSDTKVFVEDCGDEKVMDMADGTRTALSGVSAFQWNHEGIEVEDGAILMSQSCNSDSSNYDLCHVSPDAILTSLTTVGFNVDTGSINSESNKALFTDGQDKIVVKELSQISVVTSGTDSKTAILSGFNILATDVKNATLFYSAEDNQGNPVLGKFDLDSSEDTEFESDLRFVKVAITQETAE